MKRKRSEGRRNDDTTRNLANIRLPLYVKKFFCLKEMYSDQEVPQEIIATIMYLLKSLLTFPASPLIQTHNSSLAERQIAINLKKAFPTALSIHTKKVVRPVRASFVVSLNHRDTMHITVYSSGSTVVQGSYDFNDEAIKKKLFIALDPYYALFLCYQDWKLAY